MSADSRDCTGIFLEQYDLKCSVTGAKWRRGGVIVLFIIQHLVPASCGVEARRAKPQAFRRSRKFAARRRTCRGVLCGVTFVKP